MNFDWSLRSVRRTLGTSRLVRSISARAACAIATVFLPDCFVICMRTPALPLMRWNERRSSVVSRTSAMSRR